MIVNPVVETKYYVDGVEVITPRSIPNYVAGAHDTTSRNWLRRAGAPKPYARSEGGRVFWRADEAIPYIEKKMREMEILEAQGKRVGRPRQK